MRIGSDLLWTVRLFNRASPVALRGVQETGYKGDEAGALARLMPLQ